MPEPTYEDVYEPPILDSTFSDKMDELKAALSPQASGVHVSTANMHYITEDDAQGALAELDAEAYAINASLAQYIKRKFITIPSSTASGTYLTNDITVDDGYSFLCVTQCLGQGFVPTIPIMVDDDTKRLWYQGTIPSNQQIKVIYLEIRNV